MEPECWGVFHDGYIKRIEGCIPGEIKLHVRVLYLREMFPGKGTGFVVNLQNCSFIEYQEFDEEPTRDLELIENKEPGLLYVQSVRPLIINCAMGTLRMEYDSASLTLDTGEPVSDVELDAACKGYWDAWERKCKEAPNQ